ncbi:MAG TPA: LysR family transcriptional regulator [Chthoniobacterales bacterium]|nr:LysR family transcriptional regulator [Chthoniobacterales bacterium]
MLSQLRVFLVALEEGSLNRAAARLRMSQSALSRQMQSLEHEIGGALLERTTSGVRPTDIGHALAASMSKVLVDYDTAFAEARRLARGQRDLIRIGYLGSAAQTFLDPSLAALRRTHPEVKVKLLDLSPGEQIAGLRKGELDLAITGQEGGFAASEFYTRKLATMPVVALMPDDHPLANRKKIALKELRHERFLSAPEADLPGRDRWIVQLCRRAGFRPNFVQGANSVSEAFSMVNSEGLIAIGPAYLKTFAASGVARVEISDPKATWDFIIVWQRGKASASLRALLDTLSTTIDRKCEEAKAEAK